MKRLLLIPLICFALVGCGAADRAGEIVEIAEKMFATQMSEIFVNKEDYLGKTLVFEGMYSEYKAPNGITYKSVYRNTNGCCGTDGTTGLEVAWNESGLKENDWVRVSGILTEYKEDGTWYLRVKADSIEKLDERGLEFVTQ